MLDTYSHVMPDIQREAATAIDAILATGEVAVASESSAGDGRLPRWRTQIASHLGQNRRPIARWVPARAVPCHRMS